MTPEEFLLRMEQIEHLYYDDYRDPEVGHERADALLCEALARLGYDKGVEVFKRLEKWYS